MHILCVKKIYLRYAHYLNIDISFEINIVICHSQKFAVPNFRFWYFLRHPDIKDWKMRCQYACEINKYIVNEKTYRRKNNYHFERLYKATCYKMSNFSPIFLFLMTNASLIHLFLYPSHPFYLLPYKSVYKIWNFCRIRSSSFYYM